MKRIILILLAQVVVGFAAGQSSLYNSTNNTFQRKASGFITTLPGPPPGIEGTFYLDEKWTFADLVLTDDLMIEAVQVKIDLKNYLVEINYNQQVKVLGFERIKSLTLKKDNGKTEYMINGNLLTFNGSQFSGLFTVLVDEEYKLLRLTRAVEVASNYNAALDVGSKDARIKKEYEYFLMRDNNTVHVENKKQLTSELKTAFNQDFSKEIGKAKLKEEGLIRLVENLKSTKAGM